MRRVKYSYNASGLSWFNSGLSARIDFISDATYWIDRKWQKQTYRVNT
jgi:hypothetical protein